MHATPRNPICAPVAAALPALPPAEASRWADLLSQPATAMGPAERRARLALRIALLQQATAPTPDAALPGAEATDGPAPDSPATETPAAEPPAPSTPSAEAGGGTSQTEAAVTDTPAAPQSAPAGKRRRKPATDGADTPRVPKGSQP